MLLILELNLEASVGALQDYYKTRYYIGEPLYIGEIYKVLKSVPGVLDVVKVKITNKDGSQYASTYFDINSNMSPDGSYLIAPANAIFEIKFPEADIKGKIR